MVVSKQEFRRRVRDTYGEKSLCFHNKLDVIGNYETLFRRLLNEK